MPRLPHPGWSATCEHPVRSVYVDLTNVSDLTVDAVLFDLDGTLVDSRHVIETAWLTWGLEYGLSRADFERHPMHGRTAAAIVKDLIPADRADEALDRIIELEATAVDGLVALPGALDLVAALPRDRWAVVTSGSHRVATTRLQAIGIEPPVLVSADDVRHGKPHPEPFLTGARLLDITPERCAVVEDARTGLEAARSAGMHTIAVTTTFPRPELADGLADIIVDRLDELSVQPTADGTLKVGSRSSGD